MKIFVSQKKVIIDMKDQVKETLEGFPESIPRGILTPAASHLHLCDDSKDRLDKARSDAFHSTVAKLLYITKRARPDIEPTVAFLCTRVTKSNMDDWKKLKRLLGYLLQTKNEVRIIGASTLTEL